MSRLTDLIARAKTKDAQLGTDLEREFRALSTRRAFGLNFERHQPEAVELPNRPVRKGDKVRVLRVRGSTSTGDDRLWKVKAVQKGKGHLTLIDGEKSDAQEVAICDLVVVAEFQDFIYPGLISTGRLECGGDRPFHTVINAENYLDKFLEDSDYAVIEDAFKRAGRELSPDVARTYADYRADKAGNTDIEEALIDARTDIAAMGLVADVRVQLEAQAEKLANDWFDQFHDRIKTLSDERQEAYRQIRGMSAEPQTINLARPGAWLEATMLKDVGGAEAQLPAFKNHLMCDEHGNFPALLNEWEADVLKKELDRTDAVAWYRNPGRPTQESLGVVYELDGLKILRPDFIFFVSESGRIVADLIDPHSHHLADALPKICGLIELAKAHPDAFRRVESVSKVDDVLRCLDLTDTEVQQAALNASSALALYNSSVSQPY